MNQSTARLSLESRWNTSMSILRWSEVRYFLVSAGWVSMDGKSARWASMASHKSRRWVAYPDRWASCLTAKYTTWWWSSMAVSINAVSCGMLIILTSHHANVSFWSRISNTFSTQSQMHVESKWCTVISSPNSFQNSSSELMATSVAQSLSTSFNISFIIEFSNRLFFLY